MARLRSAKAPSPATTDATRRPILREKTNTMGTPGPAAETSMLALKNFKRRPRQGSMLEMVKHRRSSVARQSLAASVLQQQEDDQEDTSVFDLGSASEDEEEAFAPEAEGTPVHLNKTRKSVSARKPVSAAKSDAPRSSTKRNKRKSGDLEDSSHSALDALRKKHRKSEPSHIEDEHLPADDETTHSADHALSDHQTSPVPDRTASEVQVVNSSPRHSSPLTSPASSRSRSKAGNADVAVPSTEEQERAQIDLNDDDDDELDVVNATMAEPVSSSPVASPIPETQRTDIYADPQTQASPPPPEPAKTRSQNKKQPVSLSTAKLRALLPRRTQKPQPRPRRTEYDIPSDEEDDDNNSTAFETTHLDDDEDELGGRLRRKAKVPTTQTKKKPPAPAKAKAKAKSKPAAPTTRKGAAAPQTSAKSKGKGPTRTYGRATTTLSDKENAGADESPEPSSPSATEQGEDEDDTTLTMRESVAHSKELEEARRKFAEVDEWDLSFESMSNEDHRSSSQNWR